MKIPLADLTVIIPFFNDTPKIYRAIYSIINQSLQVKEIIIINDASNRLHTKNLLNFLKMIKKNIFSNIEIINFKKNLGPGSARNAGWNKAKTRYIAFLDSDDSWHPRKVELQYNFMIRNKQVDISGHSSTNNFKNTNGNWEKQVKKLKFYFISKHFLLFHNFFTTPTVMLKKNINIKFQENKYYTEDFLLWLECIFLKLQIVYIRETLTYLHKPRLGHSGLTKNITKMSAGERNTYKVLYDKNNISKPLYFLCIIISYFKIIKRKFFR